MVGHDSLGISNLLFCEATTLGSVLVVLSQQSASNADSRRRAMGHIETPGFPSISLLIPAHSFPGFRAREKVLPLACQGTPFPIHGRVARTANFQLRPTVPITTSARKESY